MNPLAQPFEYFRVQAFYGVAEAALSWKLAPGFSGNLFFYRSETGTAPWKLLNPDNPAGGDGEFIDDTVSKADPFSVPKYKAVLDQGGPPSTWLTGPAVSALDFVTRKEYFLTREVMRREYRAFSGDKGDGTRAFYLVPKTEGDPTRTYDPETGQILGPDCPDDPDSGFGLPWKGGFKQPLQTWVKIVSLNPEEMKEESDMTRQSYTGHIRVRLLAFPKPQNGDMIVFPGSDRRFVVTTPIERFMLRGNSPLFWEAPALSLDKTDPRYRVRMPDLRPDPTSWKVR